MCVVFLNLKFSKEDRKYILKYINYLISDTCEAYNKRMC